jgi:hypothetical protein
MAIPVGIWNVVTNLHAANLNITNVDAQGKLTGTIQVSSSETHNIGGTWDATKNELTFNYSLVFSFGTGQSFLFPVSFTGYLLQAHSGGLFMQPPGTVSGPTWNLLAGTYQAGFFFPPNSHPSGWVARLQ